MAKNQIQFIVDEIQKKNFTVLMTSTHPMTDTNVCKTGYQFFNLNIKEFPIKWPKDHPVPDNMKIINSLDELSHRPDVILSQNIVDQYNIFKQLSLFFDCPIVQFEHTVPTDVWIKTGIIGKLLKDAKPTLYGFITDFSRQDWGRKDDPNAFTVNHMVDTNFYKSVPLEKEDGAMILANAFNQRMWALGNIPLLLDKAIKQNIEIKLYGHNPGFESVTLSKDAVLSKMNKHKVFINTSLRSPIPASLLEAAACGMVIVSTKTCAIPEFFEDKKNILFYNTDEECLALTKDVIANYDNYKHIGVAAQENIKEKFSETAYVDKWKTIFKSAVIKYHEN